MLPNAIILAGGIGTRLQSIVSDVPKPMAIVANRPFLTYLLDFLDKGGISQVIMSVGYKHHVIKEYFGATYKGIKIHYVVEKTQLGTGGAIRKSLIASSKKESLILNGDTFYNLDIGSFIDSSVGLITIGLKYLEDMSRYGAVLFKNNRLTGFLEKNNLSRQGGYINAGIYLIQKAILDSPYFQKEVFSFEEDFLEKIVSKDIVGVFPSNNYFIDIGIPEDYKKANVDFKEFKNLS